VSRRAVYRTSCTDDAMMTSTTRNLSNQVQQSIIVLAASH